MFEQLTIHHCLYHIEPQQLQAFIYLTKKYTFHEDIATPLSLQHIDNCAVVLQIWCMFNEEKYKFVFNSDKMMAYACNYHCLQLLRTDKQIKNFMRLKRDDEQAIYTLSYYLAYVTLQWIYELMLEHEQGLLLIETNKTRNYFLFSQEQALTHNSQHSFYVTQRFITQLMIVDYKKTSRYNGYIRFALTSTHNALNRKRT